VTNVGATQRERRKRLSHCLGGEGALIRAAASLTVMRPQIDNNGGPREWYRNNLSCRCGFNRLNHIFYFSRRSWRESNKTTNHRSHHVFRFGRECRIPLSLLVENTGNRPAKNVRLTWNNVLDDALVAKPGDALRKHVERGFSDDGVIPVLANEECLERFRFPWCG